MNLIEIENNIARPTLEAYTFPIVKDWLEVDTSDVVIQKLSFIYHCSDVRSSFEGSDPDKRIETVCKVIIKDDSFIVTPDMLEVIEMYKEIQENNSAALALYRGAVDTIYKTVKYFKAVDYEERDGRGNPVYKVSDVMSALAKTSPILKSLDDMKQKVMMEQFTSQKTRNNRQISNFER
jgi:hypothetical protein